MPPGARDRDIQCGRVYALGRFPLPGKPISQGLKRLEIPCVLSAPPAYASDSRAVVLQIDFSADRSSPRKQPIGKVIVACGLPAHDNDAAWISGYFEFGISRANSRELRLRQGWVGFASIAHALPPYPKCI